MPEPRLNRVDRASIFYSVSRISKSGRKAELVDVTERVIDFTFEDTERGVDKLKLTVDNFDLAQFDDPLFEYGSKLQVTWGVGPFTAPVRRMLIKKVTGALTLSVEAAHEGIVMDSLRRVRKFTNVTRSDVVELIAKEYNFRQPDIEVTLEVFDEISQANLSDAQLLRKLAHLQGFQFYLDFNGLHWHERDLDQAPRREYIYYTDPNEGEILDFSIENDITRRPGRVKVKSRDPLKKTDIEANASNTEDTERVVLAAVSGTKGALDQYIDPATGTGGTFAPVGEGYVSIEPSDAEQSAEPPPFEPITEPTVLIGEIPRDQQDNPVGFIEPPADQLVYLNDPQYDEQIREQRRLANERAFERWQAENNLAQSSTQYEPDGVSYELAVTSNVQTENDAKQEAKKHYRLKSQGAVKMKMTLRGDPSFVAKSIIKVSGLGKRVSGKYYVKSVTHSLSASGGYTMAVDLITDGFQSKGKKGGGKVSPDTSILDATRILGETAMAEISSKVSSEGNFAAQDATLLALFKEVESVVVMLGALGALTGAAFTDGARAALPVVRRFAVNAAAAKALRTAATAADVVALLQRHLDISEEPLAEGKLNTKEPDTNDVTPSPFIDAEGETQTRYEVAVQDERAKRQEQEDTLFITDPSVSVKDDGVLFGAPSVLLPEDTVIDEDGNPLTPE